MVHLKLLIIHLARFLLFNGWGLNELSTPIWQSKRLWGLNEWGALSNDSKCYKGNLSYTSIRLLLMHWVILWCPYSVCTPEAKYFTRFFRTPLHKFLRCLEANGLSWRRVKDLSSLNFDRQFPMPIFLCLFKTNQG